MTLAFMSCGEEVEYRKEAQCRMSSNRVVENTTYYSILNCHSKSRLENFLLLSNFHTNGITYFRDDEAFEGSYCHQKITEDTKTTDAPEGHGANIDIAYSRENNSIRAFQVGSVDGSTPFILQFDIDATTLTGRARPIKNSTVEEEWVDVSCVIPENVVIGTPPQ